MKLLKFISLSILAVSLFSCEKNDFLADLGPSKGFAASVNMETQSEIVLAGKKLNIPVVYWMKEGVFTDLSLNQTQDSIVEMALTGVANTDFYYEHLFAGEILEQEKYNSAMHSEGSWSNAYYGYRIKTKYTVSRDLKIKNYNSTQKASSYISTEMYNEMYEDFALQMSDAQLAQILVTDNAIMTQAEFDSCFDDEGSLTTEGMEKLVLAFSSVPNESIVGSSPKVKRITEVQLQYFVENDKNNIGKSNVVSFIVK
ncbi:MAG: hypothetical protein KAH10_05275 [Flavobacteriales bacterium]|nr:hypothetical protein [Flavobacteriales bacterium]